MMSTDGDAFLPTDIDRVKAQINELRVRLVVATEKRKKLKRQIIEEDLSYVVVSKITEGIKDPTRTQAHELEGLQKEIFEQLLSTAENCTVHEIISYHRLSGRTVFDFSKHYLGIRLETFYNKVYKEPYYILFLKKNLGTAQRPDKVDKHTIPKFVPVEVLATRFLPRNMETFLRIVHDCVQAFVSRRELIHEVEQLSPKITIQYKSSSYTKIEFKMESWNDVPTIIVIMLYKNYASAFPTDIVIKNFDPEDEIHDYSRLEDDLLHLDTKEVFTRFINGELAVMNAENNERNQNADTTVEKDENNSEPEDHQNTEKNNNSELEERQGTEEDTGMDSEKSGSDMELD